MSPADSGNVWTPVRPIGLGPVIVLLTPLAGVEGSAGCCSKQPAPQWHQRRPALIPSIFGTLQIAALGQPCLTVFLSSLPFTIGRPLCNLVLSVPEVLRTRTPISAQNNSLALEDLESSNSTWISVQRVQGHVLHPEAEIQIGHPRLRFSPHADDPIRLH